MTMFSRISVRPWTRACLAPVAAVFVLLVGYPDDLLAQFCARCNRPTVQNRCNCCPDGHVVPRPSGSYATIKDSDPGAPSDPDTITTQPDDLSSIDSNVNDFVDTPSLTTGQLASAFGGGAGAAGVPGMIGDFFGNNYQYDFLQSFFNGAIPGPTTVAVGGGDRRFKLSDNNSPFPRDRVFYNYHHFHNAVRDVFGEERNVNRSVFGIEKTFWCGWGSFELRVPFAGTVSSTPVLTGNDVTGTEFGNLSMAVKSLVVRSPSCAISVGLGMVLPTGEDFEIVGAPITNIFRNESVHLQPFLGVYHAHGSRGFSQFFTQFDFATNGSDVTLDQDTDSLTTQSLLMIDYSLGYWLCRNRCAKYIRGVAPMIEWHYTTTVEDQDYGIFRNRFLFVIDDRRDVFNITGGLFLQLGDMSSLKLGAVAPLRTDDKVFDSEFGLQFSRRY